MDKKLYLELCDKLDEINNRENPCQIEGGTCIAHRKGLLKAKTCCRGCVYLGNKGCLNPNVGCKVYYCLYAWSKISQKGKNEIETIKLKAMGNNFPGIMGEKEL